MDHTAENAGQARREMVKGAVRITSAELPSGIINHNEEKYARFRPLAGTGVKRPQGKGGEGRCLEICESH